MRNIKKILYNYHFDIMIFAFLTFQMYLMMPAVDNIRDWCSTPYALNYSLGFASRLFIGSIVRLLTPYLTEVYLHRFICISLMTMFVALSLFLGSCIRSLRKNDGFIRTDDAEAAVFALIALYLASPSSPAFLFHQKNFGRMDIYLIIFTLISLFIARREPLTYLIIPLSIMSVATHQVYIFTYFPLIIGVLLYHMYESRFDKHSILLFSSVVVLTCAAFAYFQFYGELNVHSQASVFAFTFKHARVPINLTMIEFEYFRSISDHAHWFVTQERLVRGIVAFALSSPLFAAITYVFVYSFMRSSNKLLRFIFVVFMLLPLLSIPAFLLTVDWGRWFASQYAGQLLLILYLGKIKCEPVIFALKRLSEIVRTRLFIVLLLLLYFSLLGKFRDDEFPYETVKIVDQFFPELSKEPMKLMK
jgi:hypothetical protein